jgi:hypothetical protein
MHIKHYAVFIGVLVLAVVIAAVQYKQSSNDAMNAGAQSEIYIDGTVTKVEGNAIMAKVNNQDVTILTGTATKWQKHVAVFGVFEDKPATASEFKPNSPFRAYYTVYTNQQSRSLYELPAVRVVLMGK